MALPEADLMRPAPVPETDRHNVIVIGAGIVGLASALWLQKLGHRVTIIDRDPPLPGSSYRHAASYGNACTIAPYSVTPIAMPGIAWRVPGMLADPEGPLSIMWGYMPALTPWLHGFLASSSKSRVERISSVLGTLMKYVEPAYQPLHEAAGTDHLLRRNGSIYLYKSEQEFAADRYSIDLHERFGARMDRLTRDEIRDLEPNIAPIYHRGIWFRDAHHLMSPKTLAFAFARHFETMGGTFVSGEVRGLTSTPTGIIAELGHQRVEGQRLVITGGAWSKSLARMVGDDVLLDTERGYHVLFPEDGHQISRPICFAEMGFYIVPMADGLRAAGAVELGGLKAPMRKARTDAIRRGVHRLFPKAGHGTDEWMGFRPSMPDSLPVIGRSTVDPRVSYGFGHGHVGVTLAAVTGRLIGDLVSDRQPFIDLAPLRPNRFTAWGKPL